MKVIGYYDYTYDKEFLNRWDLQEHELIGSTLQLCFGRVANEYDKDTVKFEKSDLYFKEEGSDDIIEKMLNLNLGRIVEYENLVAKILFDNPIPIDIFKKYYSQIDEKNYIYEKI